MMMKNDNKDIPTRAYEIFKDKAVGLDFRKQLQPDEILAIMAVAFRKEDFSVAEEAMTLLERRFHGSDEATVGKAVFKYMSGNSRQAYSLFQSVNRMALMNKYPKILLMVAYCAFECRDFEAMLTYYTAFLNIASPDSDEEKELWINKCCELLGSVSTECANIDIVMNAVDLTVTKYPRPEVFNNAITIAIHANQSERGKRYIEQYRQTAPDSPDLWELGAFFWRQEHDMAQVKQCCERYFQLRPSEKNGALAIFLAEAQHDFGEFEAAARTAKRAVKMCSRGEQQLIATASGIAAECYHQLGNYAQELKYLDVALSYYHDDTNLWIAKVQNLFDNQHKAREAVATLRKAISQCGRHEELYGMLANVELTLFNQTQDLYHLKEADKAAFIATYDRDAQGTSYYIYARIKIAGQDYDKALEYFEKAYKLDPDIDDILFDLVVANKLTGHKIKFRRMYKLLREQDSDAREKVLKAIPGIEAELDAI